MMMGNNWLWDNPKIWWFIGPLALLDLVLRGFALWRSAQKKQQWWFIALLVVNSLGILPAVYLWLTKDKEPKIAKKTSKKK